MNPSNGASIDAQVLEDARGRLERLTEEIAKVYIGSPEVTEMLLIALLTRGHVLLEGVPGVAKTTLVKAFARTLGARFSRIQFTPDLLPSDITGTFILNLKTNDFELRRGPIFANIVLGDEINRSPAKTQSALLEAMQETQVTIEGQTQGLAPPFMVLATQNPIEEEGVYILPEAQVDRFLFRLVLDYPEENEEIRFLRTYNGPLPDVGQVLDSERILALGEVAERVHVEPDLTRYIVRLIRHTRLSPRVLLGVSPRGALMLMRAAKVRGMLHGRGFVLPDDIRTLARYALPHRIVLTAEAEMEGLRAEDIVQEALTRVPYTGSA